MPKFTLFTFKLYIKLLVLFCVFCNSTFLKTLKFRGMKSQIVSCVSILENTVESHGFGRKRCLGCKTLLESSMMLVKYRVVPLEK